MNRLSQMPCRLQVSWQIDDLAFDLEMLIFPPFPYLDSVNYLKQSA